MRGCSSIRRRAQPPMGWLYGTHIVEPRHAWLLFDPAPRAATHGWFYGMRTWRHAMRGCMSIRPRVQPPMGWLYGIHDVAPRDAWLLFDPASRAATHGVALRDARRGAMPCVAALRSGPACSHPWGGSTGCTTWRHAMRGCSSIRRRVQPPMGWLYGMHIVEPRHAWLLFDPAPRAATHGVALRESGGVPGSVVRRRQRVAAPGCRVDRARHDGLEAVGLE